MEEFEAKITDAKNGMDAAYVIIPFDVKSKFGSGRPKIKATFDHSVTYRGSLVRMKTPYHILLLRKDIRKQLNKGIGDILHVQVELDITPRTVKAPPFLVIEFGIHPEAKTFFDTLPYTCKKEYVQYITEAKRTETQIRRVQKVIQMLKDKKKYLR
jgi:Domain of unknown function (DUF1905)/Bacteriocin-protection, YdeI or OmpD-Associated